jgi:hypothetical protein
MSEVFEQSAALLVEALDPLFTMQDSMKYLCLISLILICGGCARSVTYKYNPGLGDIDKYPAAQKECAKYGLDAIFAEHGFGDFGSQTKTYWCVERHP